MRPVLAALVLLFAGCSQAPWPGQPYAATPEWHPGDVWNYTVLQGGNVTGWVRYTVETVEAVPELAARAYRVRIASLAFGDPDHDRHPNETHERVAHFDAANLNQVWNLCDEGVGFGDCRHRWRDPDFPLWEGKTWRSMTGDDTPVEYEHQATSLGDRTWSISLAIPGKSPHQVDLYDADTRFFRERSWPQGQGSPYVPETWVLQEAPSER